MTDRDNMDLYYQIKLDSFRVYKKYCENNEDYDKVECLNGIIRATENGYVTFYLKEFPEEGRFVIREFYKVLHYNPNIRR